MMNNGPQKIAYINAYVVDPSQKIEGIGLVLTKNKDIIQTQLGEIDTNSLSDFKIIDCKKAILAPGFIDIKTHIREPGEEHKETILSASLSACSSGITSVVCMPNTIPVIDQLPSIEYIQRKARKNSTIKIYPAASITKNMEGKELTEMGLLSNSGAIAFTDAIRAVSNTDIMVRALKYANAYNVLLMQHPEEPLLAKGGVMNAGILSTKLGVKGIPFEAELIQVERDIRLAEMTGGRLHFFNISTRKSLEAIHIAQEKNINITCSTSPHYFKLTEESVKDWRTFAKVSPPLRTEDDRQAVEEAISNKIITCIASDHSPHDTDTKRLPFEQASSGAIGFDSLLPISLELFHKKKITLMDLISQLSTNAANLLNINTGTLKKGSPADIVVFNADKDIVLSASNTLSKSKNSLYEDYNTKGSVLYTIIDGKIVYNGK